MNPKKKQRRYRFSFSIHALDSPIWRFTHSFACPYALFSLCVFGEYFRHDADKGRPVSIFLICQFSFSAFSYNAFYCSTPSPTTPVFILQLLLLHLFLFCAFSSCPYICFAHSLTRNGKIGLFIIKPFRFLALVKKLKLFFMI